jgi:hypothetical protein
LVHKKLIHFKSYLALKRIIVVLDGEKVYLRGRHPFVELHASQRIILEKAPNIPINIIVLDALELWLPILAEIGKAHWIVFT